MPLSPDVDVRKSTFGYPAVKDDSVAMASLRDTEDADQVVPEDDTTSVKSIQSHYLRSPSPSRFSVISDTDTESIFMEPIHLSSGIAAKQIISEELKPKEIKLDPVPESMLESAEQLMVEDLYNRVKDMMDDSSPYNTPCVLDIQRAVVQDRLEAPFNPVDEVWPNTFIGEKSVAVNKSRLKRLGITHILNAAHGTGVYTGQDFYAGMNIQYLGIEVDDFVEADISPHLRGAAEFLDEALLTHKGRVLVNSMMGVSRSAVFVAAYLMIFHHMTIMEALLALRKKRPINPNEGFLKQLRDLNETLLEERDGDRDDGSDTLSQGSVIEVRPREHGGTQSILGAKVHSIMAEEEEDGKSMISSVMSSQRPTRLDQHQEDQSEETEPVLPEEWDDEDNDLDRAIHEWQKRNEKYQSEEWWQTQLMCEDKESILGGSCLAEDLESISSKDIQALKEQLGAGQSRRHQGTESICSEDSSSSCADMWKRRLNDIEKQVAARYRGRHEKEDQSEDRDREDDEESVLSESGSSLFNFCKKNKDRLTPLERWRVKRIQFGWNKKDSEAEKAGLGEQGGAEGEDRKTPAPDEVNLTAYQIWKLKQQKKLGLENKDEIVELARGEDSASVKRKQRREEILERSRQTLEESQSMCSWDAESSLSAGTIPLSAFWPAMSRSVAGDDTASMLSMQSGRSSTVSQSRSLQSMPQMPPMVPTVPLPNMQGPGNEMLNLASIQNWISNVVAETLIQKQNEMMMLGGSLPPSRPGSVLSLGVKSGQPQDDDKVSMLSGASSTSSLSRTGANSVLSLGGTSGTSVTGSRKGRITTTSVPLYSLFQDEVDLQKLDSIDKGIKSEMKDKMAAYELKKITEDNKRSTLFKKKKTKEDEDGEDNEVRGTSHRQPDPVHKKPERAILDAPGRLSSVALDGDKTSSIDKWLNGISAPSRSPMSHSTDSLTHRATTESLSSRRRDFRESSSNGGGEEYGHGLRFSSRSMKDPFSTSRLQASETDLCSGPSLESSYNKRKSALEKGHSANGMLESHSCGTRRSYGSDEDQEEEEDVQEFSAKKKFSHCAVYDAENTEVKKGSQEEDEEEDEISSFLSRSRLRSRAVVEEELQDEDVITSWRKQLESKSYSYRGSES
nr:inactive dual specificity phosphatase 27 isoform X1 [Paramormyrops kingsleyae]